MEIRQFAQFFLLIIILAHGSAMAQDFEIQGQTLSPASIDEFTVASIGGCNATAVSDPTATVFKRADAAREYEVCMSSNLARIRVAQAQSGNMLSAAAIQNLSTEINANIQADVEAAQAAESFMGLSWGLGFGFSFGSDDFIEDAEIVDGIVRVTEDKTDQARVVLEFHRYFWCNNRNRSSDSGCGPFVALAASSDDIVKGVGLGFMWGMKSRDPTKSDGFSVGIGAILDNDVKSLGDGFTENAPPPMGETSVRFKKEARWSGLIFVTRTF